MSNRVAAVATRPLRAVPEFLRGVALLGRGFAFWSVRPGLMALGLLPAVLVGAGLITGARMSLEQSVRMLVLEMVLDVGAGDAAAGEESEIKEQPL